jgi:hypothetical protein
MKTLIYGMQSSGASLFTYWLSQQENSLSVIDLYYNQLMPRLDHDDVVVKCVVSKEFSIENQVNSFKPDRVILFVRNPVENYLSLSEKVYANYGGLIKEKFAIMDSCIGQKKYDIIVRYEDFIMGRVPDGIGSMSYFNFNRTLDDIKKYNFIHSEWCRFNFRKKWGIGNIHANSSSLLILNERKEYKNLSSFYGD